ncbi:beta-lactamase [Natrialba asiatica DSM 12278]|uniref:Beta-lactamase n=1 Tax=Natrialba asiatica (strain ATCC 700177 / DSM 12278 / JCM 9576 / FERM P-10747 / NBRC 102637 / 172P1) TaxID=29540 RepID=M0B1D4_NATA1|nr:beta-lactamase [Natrialba asiatica DSM 12278]
MIAVVGLVTLAGCGGGFGLGDTDQEQDDGERDSEAAPTAVDGELEIHHIDVGQGDSTLLVTPENETVLIDTGDWPADGREIIDYLDARGIDRIDHLVATHAHADHIGGHAGVIEHLEENGDGVGAAYDSGVAHTSATYDNYLDAIEEHDVDLFEVVEGDTLPLESEATEITVLNPPADHSGDEIDPNGVVLTVEFGEFSYLTTGDIGAETEARLVDAHGDALDVAVYQAGHHGSSTSSTDPFLDAVAPETAIISSALDSQYGHPHDEVLEAFAERDIETYWTGVHGAVVFRTDGEQESVTPETEVSTDPSVLLDRKHETNEQAALERRSGAASTRVQSVATGPGAVESTADGSRTTPPIDTLSVPTSQHP